MKRFFSTVLLLSILLAATTVTAFADSGITLINVTNGGGGPTFTFSVPASFEQSFNGYVHVSGGDSYPLYCSKTDATTIVCHTSRKITGKNVSFGFGGSMFSVHVPEARSGGGSTSSGSSSGESMCFDVFGSNDIYSPTDFVSIATHCQNTTPYAGEEITSVPDPAFDSSDYNYHGSGDWVDTGICLDSYTPHGPGYYGYCASTPH